MLRKILVCALLLLASLAAAEPPEATEGRAAPVDDDALTEWVQTELLALPAWYQDKNRETPEEHEARIRMLARIQVEVARDFVSQGLFKGRVEELVVGLMSIGFYESRYARHVHAGECRKNECDHGRAKSVYQVQNNGLVPKDLWVQTVGTDEAATRTATYVAAVNIAHAWENCGGRKQLTQVYSAYARGKCSAVYIGSSPRAAWFRDRVARAPTTPAN